MMRLRESIPSGEPDPGAMVEASCPMSHLHGCVTEVTVGPFQSVKSEGACFSSLGAEPNAELRAH